MTKQFVLSWYTTGPRGGKWKHHWLDFETREEAERYRDAHPETNCHVVWPLDACSWHPNYVNPQGRGKRKYLHKS